jgi:hypothetical protein
MYRETANSRHGLEHVRAADSRDLHSFDWISRRRDALFYQTMAATTVVRARRIANNHPGGAVSPMKHQLRAQLESIANKFVAAVLAAMSTAPLGDLTDQVNERPGSRSGPRERRSTGIAPPSKPRSAGARRKRSSSEEVELQKELAFATAKSLKPGFSKGDVMKKSGSTVNLGRALSLLVADGKLTKKGDRRLTRYWVR